MAASVEIRQWTAAAGCEPSLRIGIILDGDARESVRIRLPDREYRLALGERAGSAPRSRAAAQGHGPLRADMPLRPGDELTVGLEGTDLLIRTVAGHHFRAPAARLFDPALTPLQQRQGVCVRNVVAGRGFHWQTHIDVTLPTTIEFLPARNGVVVVNETPLETYLAGVITAEMSGDCPPEFLKAQCIVARSWLLAMAERKHDDEPFDRCNDDCCQRYQGIADLSDAALDAVNATRGRVLLGPDGSVLDANYSKSCGGISETARTVFGVDKPGIRTVVDAPPEAPEHKFFPITERNLDAYLEGEWLAGARAYCSPNVVPANALGKYLGRVDRAQDYFRWTVRYERQQLEAVLREKLPEMRDLAALRDLRVSERGVSGRARRMDLRWEDSQGRTRQTRVDGEYRIRDTLHRTFLYSSALAVRVTPGPDGLAKTITLRGAGWGHGVGMCQIGALGMALTGLDHEAICGHYYPEARLETVYR